MYAIRSYYEKYNALSTLKYTDGGIILIDSIKKDIVNCLNDISSKYKTASHTELVSLIACYTERLTLLKVLSRAEKLETLAKEELEFLLSEE